MGFIERLEQQRKTETQVRNQRESELRRKSEVEAAARKQREAREQELHQQRSQQAVNYLQESNVENLLVRLASVVEGHVGIDVDSQYSKRDADSKVVMIYWEATKIGEDGKHGGTCEWIKWDLYRAKSFAVECSPEGTIHVNGGLFSGSGIPERTWRNNINIFDVALEKVFKHPRTIRFTGNHRTEYLDGGG